MEWNVTIHENLSEYKNIFEGSIQPAFSGVKKNIGLQRLR